MGTVWTPPDPVVADSTMAREIHRHEICDAINADIAARGGTPYVWQDPPGVGNIDTINWRAVHINDLRAACLYDYNYIGTQPCATNVLPAPAWTAPDPVVAEQDLVRVLHLQELRSYINACEATCNCDCAGHCSCVGHSHCPCNCVCQCCCESHCIC